MLFDPQTSLYTIMLGYTLIHVCGCMYLCVCEYEEVFPDTWDFKNTSLIFVYMKQYKKYMLSFCCLSTTYLLSTSL